MIRWIDTLVMCADCLTKAMSETYLQAVLDSNKWNFAQTQEAKEVKLRKQAQRKKSRTEGIADSKPEENVPA